MIKAILFMFFLGLSASTALAIAARLFHMEEDPRLEAVKSALPGLNCGRCGFAGCEGAAIAVLKKRAPVTVCVCGGIEVVRAVCRATGSESGYLEDRMPRVNCFGGNRDGHRFYYDGANDCRAAFLLSGGPMDCKNACIGFGSCVSVCLFNAIRMDKDGVPEIDADKCRGCGQCEKVCPNNVIRLETLADRMLHLNETDECLAPCRQKCPAQINVPLFIRQFKKGKKADALLTIKDRNPFPMTVGRTCPHPCENICRRNIADQSLAVGHLQRFLGDWEYHSGKRIQISCCDDTGKKAAVIGGGPAGLACAYFLRCLGHQPEIFESRSSLGGMMIHCIPGYRLPKHLVQWEIQGIIDMGIPVRLNQTLGRDFTLRQLCKSGFDAVFLGLGAWDVPHLCVPGEYASGVTGSLEFLSGVGTSMISLLNKQVAVIGESNTAMDCARSCIRLGARSVTVICPCEQQDMSARKRDIIRAMDEGVKIEFMTRPVRIVSDDSNRAVEMEFCHVDPAGTRSKNRIMETSALPSQMRLKTDLIIGAYERKPDMDCLINTEDRDLGFHFTRQSTISVDADTLLAAAPNIFAAGDFYTGRATIIGAVAGARKAARCIHYYLKTGTIPISDNVRKKIDPQSILKDIRVPDRGDRVTIKELPVEIRRDSFEEEVVSTITEKEAITECERCLQCGSFCYDRN